MLHILVFKVAGISDNLHVLQQDILSSVHAYSVSCHTRGLNDKHSHIHLLNTSLRPGDRPLGLKNFQKAIKKTPARIEDAVICNKLPQLSDSQLRSCAIQLADPFLKTLDQSDKQPRQELTINLFCAKHHRTARG